MLKIGLVLITLVFAVPAPAEIAGFEFASDQEEQQFKDLSEILRCLVCQNQSLADSNAGLARDLRTELYEQVLNGNTDAEIINFMTDRYGEFILYKPRINLKTIFLWFAPFLVFILGIYVLLKFSRICDDRTSTINPDNEEMRKVRKLLDETMNNTLKQGNNSK